MQLPSTAKFGCKRYEPLNNISTLAEMFSGT